MNAQVVVAGLHLRWDSPRQRPHHLLSRLAARVPVIVVEEPLPADVDRDLIWHDGNVTIVRPLRTRGWREPFVDDETLAAVVALVAERTTAVWLYTPMMDRLVEAFSSGGLIVDVMDDLAGFDFAPAGIAEREATVLARADVVFTGGRTLYERRRGANENIHCFPSGVEIERFLAEVGPHPLLAALPGACFTYIGAIDERVDLGLVSALADARPRDHVVMVGPVVKIDRATLPQRENVHFAGPMPYDTLPSVLAATDVALMPFAHNAATASISPTKTLEYFAARRPVVTTAVADVVAAYTNVVYVGDGAEAFVRAADDALHAPAERIEAGVAFARATSWDATFAQMWALLP